MCDEPQREFTVTCQGRDYPARVLLDSWPDSPRVDRDNAAELVQLDTGRYRQPDPDATLATEVLHAWDRYRDEQLIGRYLTVCHDVVAWDYRTPPDGRLFGYLTRDALRRAWPDTAGNRRDPTAAARGALLVAAELDTYQQWVNGDVYVVEVSDPRDERVASLCGIYTTGGNPHDPYIDEIAHELAISLDNTSGAGDPINVGGPAGVRGAAR